MKKEWYYEPEVSQSELNNIFRNIQKQSSGDVL